MTQRNMTVPFPVRSRRHTAALHGKHWRYRGAEDICRNIGVSEPHLQESARIFHRVLKYSQTVTRKGRRERASDGAADHQWRHAFPVRRKCIFINMQFEYGAVESVNLIFLISISISSTNRLYNNSNLLHHGPRS